MRQATKGHTMNATHKRAVSYKLTAPTVRKLADLAAHYEVSVTALIEMLVAERHAAVYGTLEAPRHIAPRTRYKP